MVENKKAKKKVLKKCRDIGIDVKYPKNTCTDRDCPFHGTLPVRGRILECTVVTDKMDKSAIVERRYLRYIPKYERYEKRTSRYAVHNPPCINAKVGDTVKIGECRPLSKTISFVIIEKTGR
jgi:small subunit ribosomal protein S17